MNTEMDKTPLGRDAHPDENQLLLALERELSPAEVSQVEQHLGNCWSCRARYSEIQRGILAFVEYREKRYLPSLETPPHDFREFSGRLRSIVEESKSIGLPVMIWRRVSSFRIQPNQLTWTTVTAVMMVLVIFWTQVVSPPAVSASELLTRAAAAQNPNTSGEKSGLPRTARQRVRITSGQQTVVRDFEWAVGSPIAQARWAAQTDPLKWNAPLTAEGFAQWRDSVSTRKDKVKRTGDRLTLETTAGADLIKGAWIVVRAQDFHPVEQHIRFADHRQLDFEELEFEIDAVQSSRSVPTAQIAQSALRSEEVRPVPTVRPHEIEPARPADLNETELEVRYTMFTQQWDLGEELTITRIPGSVAVSGTASSAERAASMQTILGSLPNVQLSITAPGAVERPPAPNSPLPAKLEPFSSSPLLKDVLDSVFTSSEERREFVDRCLGSSDVELAHAWSLKKLVDRYTEAEARLLTPESRARIEEMLHAHLQHLGEANAGLDPLIELLPGSRGQRPDVPGTWRAGILALFAQAQQQDSLVASLVAGTQANGQNAAAASQRLRSTHSAIGALLSELKNLEVER